MTGEALLHRTLREALAGDPAVSVLGEALELSAVTRGLRDGFPGRVHLLPAADATLLGLAVGMALAGGRPVVELAGGQAAWGALQQLGQEAASLTDNAEFPMPVVVRIPLAPGEPLPLEALLGAPGLRVAVAGAAGEGAALLRGALAGRGPVVLIEPRAVLAGPAEVEESALQGARLVRMGTDATALAAGEGVVAALRAAEILAAEGISLEVLDLRWLKPLDEEQIGACVSRTGRVVPVGEAGVALPAAVRLAFLHLEAPPAEAAAEAEAIAAAARAAVHY